MKSTWMILQVLAILLAANMPASAAEKAGTEKPAAVKKDDVKKEYMAIKNEWARAKYETEGKDEKLKALEALEPRARDFIAAHEDRAEPKLMLGTILSTEANIIHGLSALPKLKEAKALLEDSITLDPKAENGNAHAILGALYAEVPGWPISFGDSKKAASHLEAAVKIAPGDIDANYFYGHFLLSQKKFDEARAHLQSALDAKGQSVADKGRRAEAQEAMKQLEKAEKQPAQKQYN